MNAIDIRKSHVDIGKVYFLWRGSVKKFFLHKATHRFSVRADGFVGEQTPS
jgi:hypothetical protein